MPDRISPRELKPTHLHMAGFSARLVDEHYNIIYKGYVAKLNEIRGKLDLASRTAASPTYSELRSLKVEESFTLNAIRLHEWYFENLGGVGGPAGGPLADLLRRDFGSLEGWADEFKASAALTRGRVVLAYDLYDGRLRNFTADAHNLQGIWGVVPILVLDAYEHAYALDYGARRGLYVEAFLKNVDWSTASGRLAVALQLRQPGGELAAP